MTKPMSQFLRIVFLVLLAAAAYWFQPAPGNAPSTAPPSETGERTLPASGSIDHAHQNRQSNVMVNAAGEIVKLLPDDDNPPRHQRFIVRLPSKLTVLIAHNIDLAPRVPNPRRGTILAFQGEYEYNDRGGVVHWTHHDPQGRHAGGWLHYAGEKYQ